jgi:hypothetical protein
MNIMHVFPIKLTVIFFSLLLFATTAIASNITVAVDGSDPSNDGVVDLNLERLLPIADGNIWDYLFSNNIEIDKSITASVGDKEKIGGGCLQVQPINFGGDLSLYLANYGDHLSLHGFYLLNWKGLEDVSLKFETRNRVEWKDFDNKFVSGNLNQNSCQNTGRGWVERTGLVFLENLNENLGEPGTRAGDIDCSTKNSDLREARLGSPVQNGSGLATVKGSPLVLYWSLDELTYFKNAGGVSGAIRIHMTFNPNLVSLGNDYTIYIDMTLTLDKGITALYINDDKGSLHVSEDAGLDQLMDQLYDLSYELDPASPALVSTTNELTPSGLCLDEGGGRFSFLMCFLLLGLIPLRKAYKAL